MKATWLADVLRAEGLNVLELDDWRTRGRELRDIRGVVWHHTATGKGWTDQRVATLLRVGRSDLAGPLCQLGLQRDGTFVLVAAGRGNHNGYGTWGNDSIGIEAYNDGIGEPWPIAQLDAYERGTAAILRHLSLPASAMKGHRETDPGRKIDPKGIDLDAARRNIAALLAPTPPPTPKDWFDMATKEDLEAVVNAALAPIAADLEAIKSETVESRDNKDGRKASMRWLVGKIAKGEKVT